MKRASILIVVVIITIILCVAIVRAAPPTIRLRFLVDQGHINAWAARTPRPEGVSKREHAENQIMKLIDDEKFRHRTRLAVIAVVREPNDIRVER